MYIKTQIKKIILTTDPDLIKNCVQAIDAEFLEWFCSKNGKVGFIDEDMYTKEQWQTLAKRFNEKKFLGKVMLIKQHQDIFKLEIDNGWCMLRLHDQQAMEDEMDMLFEFPNELSDKDIWDLFYLLDIKVF